MARKRGDGAVLALAAALPFVPPNPRGGNVAPIRRNSMPLPEHIREREPWAIAALMEGLDQGDPWAREMLDKLPPEFRAAVGEGRPIATAEPPEPHDDREVREIGGRLSKVQDRLLAAQGRIERAMAEFTESLKEDKWVKTARVPGSEGRRLTSKTLWLARHTTNPASRSYAQTTEFWGVFASKTPPPIQPGESDLDYNSRPAAEAIAAGVGRVEPVTGVLDLFNSVPYGLWRQAHGHTADWTFYPSSLQEWQEARNDLTSVTRESERLQAEQTTAYQVASNRDVLEAESKRLYGLEFGKPHKVLSWEGMDGVRRTRWVRPELAQGASWSIDELESSWKQLGNSLPTPQVALVGYTMMGRDDFEAIDRAQVGWRWDHAVPDVRDQHDVQIESGLYQDFLKQREEAAQKAAKDADRAAQAAAAERERQREDFKARVGRSDPASAVWVDAGFFKEAAIRVAAGAADDATRPVLTAIRFEVHGETLTMASADGFRLYVANLPIVRRAGGADWHGLAVATKKGARGRDSTANVTDWAKGLKRLRQGDLVEAAHVPVALFREYEETRDVSRTADNFGGLRSYQTVRYEKTGKVILEATPGVRLAFGDSGEAMAADSGRYPDYTKLLPDPAAAHWRLAIKASDLKQVVDGLNLQAKLMSFGNKGATEIVRIVLDPSGAIRIGYKADDRLAPEGQAGDYSTLLLRHLTEADAFVRRPGETDEDYEKRWWRVYKVDGPPQGTPETPWTALDRGFLKDAVDAYHPDDVVTAYIQDPKSPILFTGSRYVSKIVVMPMFAAHDEALSAKLKSLAPNPSLWCLGVPPYTPILRGLLFANKAEAQERARLENRAGEYRGRGVKVYRCDANGRILIKDNPAQDRGTCPYCHRQVTVPPAAARFPCPNCGKSVTVERRR